jgi:hypothetical protein
MSQPMGLHGSTSLSSQYAHSPFVSTLATLLSLMSPYSTLCSLHVVTNNSTSDLVTKAHFFYKTCSLRTLTGDNVDWRSNVYLLSCASARSTPLTMNIPSCVMKMVATQMPEFGSTGGSTTLGDVQQMFLNFRSRGLRLHYWP